MTMMPMKWLGLPSARNRKPKRPRPFAIKFSEKLQLRGEVEEADGHYASAEYGKELDATAGC